MACQICQHCDSPINAADAVIVRGGHNYHRKCHKCFVCSETNLSDSNNFMGVIFCDSCSNRIFESCMRAHRTQRPKHGPERSRRRRHKRNSVYKARCDERKDFVTGAKTMTAKDCTPTDFTKMAYDDNFSLMSRESSGSPTEILERRYKSEQYVVGTQQQQRRGKEKTDTGQTTTVTKQMLNHVKSHFSAKGENLDTNFCPGAISNYKRHSKPTKCSDMRIAEIGASTEIATMALRRKSESSAIRGSRVRVNGTASFTLSVLRDNRDSSPNKSHDWMESYASSANESSDSANMRFGDILKLPYHYFKSHIVEQSSIVNQQNGNKKKLSKVFCRFKKCFNEEVVRHQGRGIRKLYPTINRVSRPFKLGWSSNLALKSKRSMRCRHHRSHSYRCMRQMVMRVAGPTNSELKVIRSNIRKCISPNRIIKNFLNNKFSNDVSESSDLSDEIINESEVTSLRTSKQSTRQKLEVRYNQLVWDLKSNW